MAKKINVTKFSNFVNPCKKTQIIIQPIMRGGIVPEEVQNKLFEEGWMRVGYTVCYNCLEGRSDKISKPPIDDFLAKLASFFGGDFAEHTFASRAAQFAVMKTISKDISENSMNFTNIVLTDPLCHYTTAIAAEMSGLKLIGSPHSGYPSYKVESESFVEKIESIKKETSKLPALIAVTHVEPYYGNLNPVKKIGKIAREYGIPYMVNAAYTAGIFPIDMKDIQADFLTLSAHKSMAAIGPLGFLITKNGWGKKVFKESILKIYQLEKILGKKMVNIFGCSVGGLPLISAMYSFPYIVERVERWNDELNKTRWFASEMEKLCDIILIGDKPHNHHLMHFETPIFWEISKHHKRKGFFLADDMIKMGIIGLHRGLSKHFKISLYGLSWKEVKIVRNAFYNIAKKYVADFKLNYEVPKIV